MSESESRDRAARRRRHEAIRAEVAEEEAEAIEAAEAQIPTSALVRRLLRDTIQGQRQESPTVGEIEEIARRVAREEIAGR